MNATVSGATRIADGFNMTGPASRIVRPVIERAGAPAYSFGGRERGLARAGAEHELRRKQALADGQAAGEAPTLTARGWAAGGHSRACVGSRKHDGRGRRGAGRRNAAVAAG
ncbi:hypothetical protein TraAM80_09259 [Trypanosoma rangeli]|uniref:Uncharacterized protein n=1 Tax=Trypanosoma rangeli TaxID=5698 RepID=A0A422MWP5_TRYRA|nr:uncharacterized protein TraAM80_09259 [Trypanosoma rangeli]RNE97655.1 hypothetical protein TraAM80_09259 [Trypanosoma rangeli]|eukprot:RNE97655.1 hypothetical protein TraAM80_09259 [Trypanosoma rangeli]